MCAVCLRFRADRLQGSGQTVSEELADNHFLIWLPSFQELPTSWKLKPKSLLEVWRVSCALRKKSGWKERHFPLAGVRFLIGNVSSGIPSCKGEYPRAWRFCLSVQPVTLWIPVAMSVLPAEAKVLFNWQEYIGLIFDRVDCPAVFWESKMLTQWELPLAWMFH